MLSIFIWTLRLFRSGIIRSQRMRLLMPLTLVVFQILLGILTLFSSKGIQANHWVAFDWLALLHQLNSMLLLFSLIYAIYVFKAFYEVILVWSFR